MRFKKGALPIDLKERLKYLFRFQEMLRLFHNKKSRQFHDKKMTEDDFRRFQKGWCKKRELLLCQEINKCKDTISELAVDNKLPIEEQKDIILIYKAAKNDKKIYIDITDIEEG